MYKFCVHFHDGSMARQARTTHELPFTDTESGIVGTALRDGLIMKAQGDYRNDFWLSPAAILRIEFVGQEQADA